MPPVAQVPRTAPRSAPSPTDAAYQAIFSSACCSCVVSPNVLSVALAVERSLHFQLRRKGRALGVSKGVSGRPSKSLIRLLAQGPPSGVSKDFLWHGLLCGNCHPRLSVGSMRVSGGATHALLVIRGFIAGYPSSAGWKRSCRFESYLRSHISRLSVISSRHRHGKVFVSPGDDRKAP